MIALNIDFEMLPTLPWFLQEGVSKFKIWPLTPLSFETWQRIKYLKQTGRRSRMGLSKFVVDWFTQLSELAQTNCPNKVDGRRWQFVQSSISQPQIVWFCWNLLRVCIINAKRPKNCENPLPVQYRMDSKCSVFKSQCSIFKAL